MTTLAVVDPRSTLRRHPYLGVVVRSGANWPESLRKNTTRRLPLDTLECSVVEGSCASQGSLLTRPGARRCGCRPRGGALLAD